MAVRRDGAFVKKQRLNDIYRKLTQRLEANGGTYGLRKFIAQTEYEHGLNPKTILNYLKTFEAMESIIVDEKSGTIAEWYDTSEVTAS